MQQAVVQIVIWDALQVRERSFPCNLAPRGSKVAHSGLPLIPDVDVLPHKSGEERSFTSDPFKKSRSEYFPLRPPRVTQMRKKPEMKFLSREPKLGLEHMENLLHHPSSPFRSIDKFRKGEDPEPSFPLPEEGSLELVKYAWLCFSAR